MVILRVPGWNLSSREGVEILVEFAQHWDWQA